MLVLNVRLNTKTGNRQKVAGRTAHYETVKGTELAKTGVGNGQRNGRDGRNERRTKKRETRRLEQKCRATGSRRGGKRDS